MNTILDLQTVPDTERPMPDIERPSASVATASTIGPRGDTTSASSSAATSVNSEFSEEYQRIKREHQNRINHEQHRTRTMQRRAEILSLRSNCPADSMIEEHQLSSSDPGQRTKPPTRKGSLREMLIELDIDIDASHGRYRKRSIDRRPALSVVMHPPFEVGEAPTDVREVCGKRGRSRSMMDPTLLKVVKESGDDTYNNMEPRLTEPIAQRIRRNSFDQLSQIRRNSSQHLSQLTKQVRYMFTKDAEFDDIARTPIQPNILLATMQRCESNNLLNAIKKFDADDN